VFQNCVFCFSKVATITAAATVFSFIYLLSDYICVCISFYYMLCVSTRACMQFTHFILLFLLYHFIFRLLKQNKKNSLIYSQLKRKKTHQPTVILLFFRFFSFFFCVLVCSYLNGCCVCVCGFFSVDYRWVIGCL